MMILLFIFQIIADAFKKVTGKKVDEEKSGVACESNK